MNKNERKTGKENNSKIVQRQTLMSVKRIKSNYL